MMRPWAPRTIRVSSRKSHSSSRCPLMLFLVARTFPWLVRARTTNRTGMARSRASAVTIHTGDRPPSAITMRSNAPAIRSWIGLMNRLLDVAQALQSLEDLFVVFLDGGRLAQGRLQRVLHELLDRAVPRALGVLAAALEQISIDGHSRSEHQSLLYEI